MCQTADQTDTDQRRRFDLSLVDLRFDTFESKRLGVTKAVLLLSAHQYQPPCAPTKGPSLRVIETDVQPTVRNPLGTYKARS